MELKARVHHLLTYLLAVEELKQSAPRKVPTEWIALHQVDLKGLEGVHFNQRANDLDVWLKVERLEETSPPSLPPSLEPWVQLSRSPNKTPLLRNSIQVASSADTVETVMLDARPTVRPLFDSYLIGWRTWAQKELHRKKTIELYRKLFLVHQTISNEGADQPVELVWGMAFALWTPPDGSAPIAHPLITQACEISLNPMSFAIEVRPGLPKPRLEIACYAELGLVGVKALEATWRELLASGGDVLTPFEESSFSTIARAAVSYLDPDGAYEVRGDDLALPPPGQRLAVVSTWCLFARRRTGDLVIEDIKALMANVATTPELPSLVARFVRQQEGAITRRPTRPYRGISSTADPGADDPPALDLLFPLPYNEEQVTIVQRLDDADGVVVQGPPGTGKSHTICNIICHYLASGKRILVTAKSESALAVLRDKLPAEIRPLTVALLSAESDGNRQFEANVRTIDEELSRLDHDKASHRIARLQEELDTLHRAMADADRLIAQKALPNMQPVSVGGTTIPVMDLARQVVENAPRHSWFTDTPDADPPPALTDELFEGLRRARRRAGKELRHLDDTLPAVDGLPTLEEFLQTHRDLRRAAQLDSGRRLGTTLALREFTGTTVEDLPRLRAAIDARRARHEELAAHAWTGPLIDELRRAAPADPVMATLKGLVADVEQAETQRRNQVARAISVPDSAERNPAFREAVTRLSKGARAFLLPIGNAEQRKLLQQVTVSGGAPATPEDWSQVAAVLDWRDGLQRLVARWSSLASELGLPTVPTGAAATVIRGLTSVAAVVRLAIESVHDHDRTLAQWIARLFQPTPETAPANSLHHLDRVVGSIEAHLEQAQVTYALDRRRAYLQRLEGCSGDLSRALTSLFGEALGGSMDEEALGRSWRALTEELRRRSQFVTALRTIRATVDLLANAGAPAWAERLRTQPADPASDVDPCLPHDWSDAWMWRRHETFLQTIDAHQELRRLFGERERLARALASTYQELAAAKTWLAVSQHAGAEVRAALKGFLTAVLAMGRGTGKNAIMLRRDAKKAMAHAYPGVPCWILPHYRVSESLPAQIGLFDLVIVDEASQSDLSCMPAILRGKKLLVVGDDRQVSPSTVGVATETLADLRNRFLGFFPETIGPLMLPGRSIYDLANVVFAGEGVMLREHFRSVAPIIQWSNQHYYANKIVPLRVPTASERLDPPLVDVYVPDGKRKGDINKREAEAVLDEIAAICADPAMRGRTLGVVTLLGTAQAQYINEQVAARIPAEEILARHISVGPPPVFQGRERDVMLISMVLDPDSQGAADKNDIHQRYNVALSRARDRMILFRSITEADVNPNSPTHSVLRYFRQPSTTESQRVEADRERCESPFEIEVYDELVERGFRVVPQVKAGPYRIDLVVEDMSGRRLAIECDGDRFHGPLHWADDMARQRVLERAGWTFWRCFASTWARRRKDCIDDLIATLLRIGVGPAPPTARPSLVASRVYAGESRVGETAEVAKGGIDRASLQTLPLAVDADSASHVSELGEVNGDVLVDIPAADAGVHTPAGPLPAPVPAVGRADPATLASRADALLALLPSDGSSVGNVTLKRELEGRGYRLSDEEYFHTRQELIDRGLCVTGRGRGGSLRRCDPQDEAESGEQEATLEIQRGGANGRHSTAAARPNEDLVVAMLALIPSDGSSIGNGSLRRELELRGHPLSDEEYFAARQVLIDRGHCERGMGRGGSVRRVERQARLI